MKLVRGRLEETRGRRWVSRPPFRAAKVSGSRARSKLWRGLRCAGSSSAPAEGASLAASPRELAPRGRRGRRRPAAEGSPGGRPRLVAPPHTLSSPHPKIQPQSLGGESLPGVRWSAEQGPLQTGAPSPSRPVQGVPAPPPLLTPAREDRVGPLSREKLGGRGPMRGQGRAGGGATTHPASPPPPAGDPRAPEATGAALPSPAAATTNRNLQPRPLAVANAQPHLLTAPPQPSIRANGEAPQTQPGPASVLAYFSQEPMRRARSCSRSCSRAPPAPLGLGSSKPKTAGSLWKLACARTRAAPPRAPVLLPRRALATCAGWLRGAGPEPLAAGEGGMR